jgi:hypothetical protein
MPFRYRSDGDVVDDAPLTRRIMPFLMPTRNESLVFFDLDIAAAPVDATLAAMRDRGLHATAMHALVHAITQVLAERPRLNRFVAGGRLWQRRGTWISFSAKRSRDDGGAVFVAKRRMDPGWSLEDVARALGDAVREGRSSKRSATDTELRLALALPTLATAFAVGALRRLDAWGLLPRWFIDGDPMFASVFVANLGSLGMDAPQHHLYEYGSIGIFCALGAATEKVVAVDGAPVVKRVYPLRFTFDERIEDGLYCLTSLKRLQAILEGGRDR